MSLLLLSLSSPTPSEKTTSADDVGSAGHGGNDGGLSRSMARPSGDDRQMQLPSAEDFILLP